MEYDNVNYQSPLFPNYTTQKPLWKKALYVLTSFGHFPLLFKEFFSEKVFNNVAKIRSWISSSFDLLLLRRNDRLKTILCSIKSEDILYFYWARRSSLLLSFINGNVNSVVRHHGYDLYLERWKENYIPYRKNIVNNTKLALFISNMGQKYYQDLNPSKEEAKQLVNRLGVDISNNNFASREDFKILTISSLIELKRVKRFAKILKENAIGQQLKWIHIGDGPEKNEIDELLQDSGVNYEITGWLKSTEVAHKIEFEQPSFMLNLSTTEGIPVSIMEAMSLGLPCIATDVGGTSEIVNDTNGKLLSSNFSDSELIEAISWIKNMSEENYSELSLGAKATVSQHYSSAKNALELVQILKENFN